MDANAAWDLSKQIGDSIIKPVADAFKDWVSVIIGIAAGGGLALGTQGDLRERSKSSRPWFFRRIRRNRSY
ncbi:hypothetical protein [Rickettsia tamurae]|uniref:hypothetical protein n=1 Tax=Rickettsia tamurae TaxID=334545 RepID=UPI0030814A95